MSVVGFLFLVLLALLARLKRTDQADKNTPQHLRALKRSTAEFNIAYSELEFGKLLGKGSQGEVFRAKWRGSEVAVKKIDTRKVRMLLCV